MGTLIVIEGIDGGGKTTLARGLVRELQRAHRDVRFTREPTDGPEGRTLREAAARGERFSPARELELFFADRRRHVRDVVRPALDAGWIVVQDRTFYSTAAYQGLRGLDREAILRDSRAFAPEPDVLLVVDLPVDVALQRAESRGEGRTAFEEEASLTDIRRFFRSLPHARVLDGTQPPEVVLQCAVDVLARYGLPLFPNAGSS
jgi:dTMP kinase